MAKSDCNHLDYIPPYPGLLRKISPEILCPDKFGFLRYLLEYCDSATLKTHLHHTWYKKMKSAYCFDKDKNKHEVFFVYWSFESTAFVKFLGLGRCDTQQMETTRGTLFGAYNAVTGYFQNVRTYRDDEAKLQSIVMGGTAQMKSQKAFELCSSFNIDRAEIFNLN